MKLYVISYMDCDCCEILGAYSSREKAIASFPYHWAPLTEDCIKEIDLDPPNDTEAYEDYFYAYSSDKYSHPTKKRPSEVGKLTYVWWGELEDANVLAYGKTAEEAKARAIAGLALVHPVWAVRRNEAGNMQEDFWPHPSSAAEDAVVHEDLETARKMFASSYETI